VIIPNSSLFTNKVTVNTAYDKRRISILIGIGYADDTILAKKVILGAISKIEGILTDPAPYFLITNYGGSSVDLEIRFWLSPPRRLDVLQMRDAVLQVLKPALSDAGIDLPFPTQQILFHDQTEQSDGDRKNQREGWPSRGASDPKSRFSIRRDLAQQNNGNTNELENS
jgi:small conductance mechanosensitive channel